MLPVIIALGTIVVLVTLFIAPSLLGKKWPLISRDGRITGYLEKLYDHKEFLLLTIISSKYTFLLKQIRLEYGNGTSQIIDLNGDSYSFKRGDYRRYKILLHEKDIRLPLLIHIWAHSDDGRKFVLFTRMQHELQAYPLRHISGAIPSIGDIEQLPVAVIPGIKHGKVDYSPADENSNI